jgi:hypothetical protein
MFLASNFLHKITHFKAETVCFREMKNYIKHPNNYKVRSRKQKRRSFPTNSFLREHQENIDFHTRFLPAIFVSAFFSHIWSFWLSYMLIFSNLSWVTAMFRFIWLIPIYKRANSTEFAAYPTLHHFKITYLPFLVSHSNGQHETYKANECRSAS